MFITINSNSKLTNSFSYFVMFRGERLNELRHHVKSLALLFKSVLLSFVLNKLQQQNYNKLSKFIK